MQANALDRYVEGSSPVHRLDARVKIVITLLFVISNVLLPDGAWLAFALAWGLMALSSVLSDLGLRFVARRSFVALPFALAAVSVIFILPGQPLATWTIGPWHLVATDAGLVRFVSVVVRSWLSVQMAIILVATTPFPDLLHALRDLRVPSLLVAIVAMMYRYLAILAEEATRLLRARDARSARLPGRPGPPLTARARVAGNLAGQLFLRSYERSDRVYAAMLARGYRGEPLTLRPHLVRRGDWSIAAVAGLLLLFLQLVGRVRLL